MYYILYILDFPNINTVGGLSKVWVCEMSNIHVHDSLMYIYSRIINFHFNILKNKLYINALIYLCL